jgi:tRNA U38,U39,U40 pseudouridine synthase TruA
VVAYDGTGYGGWQLQAAPKKERAAAAAAAQGEQGDAGATSGGQDRLALAPPLPTRRRREDERPPPVTVQEVVERALLTALRAPGGRAWLGAGAAGRTDAGVHAAGQVVQFYWDESGGGGGNGGGAATLGAGGGGGAASAGGGLDLDFSRGLPARLNGLLPPDVRVLRAFRTAPDFVATASATGKRYRNELDLRPWPALDPRALRRRHHFRRTIIFTPLCLLF